MKPAETRSAAWIAAIAATLFVPTAASAQTTLNGGSFHVSGTQVNGHTTNKGIIANNATDLTIDASAKIGASNSFSSRNGLALNNSSTTTELGGSIKGGIGADGILDASSGDLVIKAGTVTVGKGGTDLDIKGSGNVTITGGKFTFSGYAKSVLTASGTGLVTINGGNFNGGSPKLAAIVSTGGTIDIYGKGLHFHNGRILGTLADGELIHASYSESQLGEIQLLDTPESSSLVLIAGGMLPLGVMLLRKRSSATAS